MKKFIIISLLSAVAAITLSVFPACANGGTQSNAPDNKIVTENGGNQIVNTPKAPTNPVELGIPANAIKLTAENKHNTATAYFDAEYVENGIVLTAYVIDDDIHDKIYYSFGYDDNVEYLIGLKCNNTTGWDENRTLHFLITPDGDTFMQRADSASTLAGSYIPSLRCVYGDNFSYSAELTDYGYRTTVFLGFELFGVSAEAGRGNLYVCPAMRNTHDYSDTVWEYFREGGCEWSNASSFIRATEDGYKI